MRIIRQFRNYSIECLIGRTDITQAKDVIETFRDQVFTDSVVLMSVDWFLSKRVVWNELPVVLLFRRAGSLQGVVLAYFSTRFGVPYGLARGGRRGDVSVVAPQSHHRELLEIAAQFLIRHWLAHTVVLTLPYGVGYGGAGSDGPGEWFPRHDPVRLSLDGGWDATLQRLSYKLRRNLRHYRRKATDGPQICFVPQLTAAQRQDAVMALASEGRYPMALPRAQAMDRMLQAIPGAFAMGLQDAAGNWLSYVVGWREPSATFVDWQLNKESDSAGTVMRSFLIEHETGRQSPALVFVGGTSAVWQRACDPAMASDLLVTGTGPVARMLSVAYRKWKPDSEVTSLLGQQAAMAGDAREPPLNEARQRSIGGSSSRSDRAHEIVSSNG